MPKKIEPIQVCLAFAILALLLLVLATVSIKSGSDTQKPRPISRNATALQTYLSGKPIDGKDAWWLYENSSHLNSLVQSYGRELNLTAEQTAQAFHMINSENYQLQLKPGIETIETSSALQQ